MGYVNNHLATLVCGIFAVVLTGLWPLMVEFASILNIVFLMAVPIMWFLVFITWAAQKAADYNHSPTHDEKKTTMNQVKRSLTRSNSVLRKF
tara:strand:- start:614 stop:889 length:276 start_codon:yes stop_codon:yes gene_type:complete